MLISKTKLKGYLPGIVLFIIALIIGLLTFQDYGISWDEPAQRALGALSSNYIVNGDNSLLTSEDANYGTAFELPLIFLEKWLGLEETRDVYLMRHLAAHLFFLLAALSLYVLIFRQYRDRILASIGFIMLVLAPRMYAHSFFNSKDIPFLSALTISLTLIQFAFDRNRWLPFLLAGAALGFSTGIRIAGLMPFAFVWLFLLIDIVSNIRNKQNNRTPIINLFTFSLGFGLVLYLSWPYIWTDPINRIEATIARMSEFDTLGDLVFKGQTIPVILLPWDYFPTWFLITLPPIWLLGGLAGLVLLMYNIIRKPLSFIQNSPQRINVLFILCFAAPIISFYALDSVIYDDWRHLYFIYPPFILLAIYFISKLRAKWLTMAYAAVAIQAGFVSYFLIRNHPFGQVYFNAFVSHDKEYLRKNYDLEYWGASYKQAFEFLLKNEQGNSIKVAGMEPPPFNNNLMMLTREQQARINYTTPENATYIITTFRLHPDDYPAISIPYTIKVLNSTIICIYKIH